MIIDIPELCIPASDSDREILRGNPRTDSDRESLMGDTGTDSDSEGAMERSDDTIERSGSDSDSLGSWSHLKHPELIVSEAFEKHPLRIPRQIASATATPMERVLAIFDGI